MICLATFVIRDLIEEHWHEAGVFTGGAFHCTRHPWPAYGRRAYGAVPLRAAELRSISTDFTKYTAAVHTFRDKYFALPGDMRTAVRFWGAQAGGTADGVDATCKALTEASPATGTATCNGNGDGDGQVDYYATGNQFETFRFWQHLANAGLIEGSYSGVYGSAGATYKALVSVNVPKSKISNSGFAVRDVEVPAGDSEAFQIDNRGAILFGTSCVGNCTVTGATIKPEEA